MDNLWVAYSGYIIAAASIAANLWQFRMRQTADREREIRKLRYEVYSEYLSKLDKVNARLQKARASEGVQQDMIDFFKEITEEQMSENSSIAKRLELKSRYTEIMTRNLEIMTDWMEEHNELLDEINKVRLVASEEVSKLLKNYSDVLRSVIESSLGIPLQFAIEGPGKIDFIMMVEYGKLYESLRRVKHELHSAMRKDIGVE